jgi:glutamine amidotransferase
VNNVIVVANSGLGNFVSISNLLRQLDVQFEVRSNPGKVKDITHLILPGVGSFDSGMESLKLSGWADEVLNLSRSAYILGICLGMHLLTRGSDEGDLQGLSLVNGKCKRLDVNGERVPHIGWNYVEVQRSNPLITLPEKQKFYFSHSYFVEVDDGQHSCGQTNYGQSFTSVLQQDNLFGVQFHPEKSHRFGAALLKNFVELK